MFLDEDGFMHMPFATLRAALDLGTKYDCERYRHTALHQLRRFFPQTLNDWDASEEFRDYYEGYGFDLLVLALSFGDPAMLPLAYYTCISQDDVVGTSVSIICNNMNAHYSSERYCTTPPQRKRPPFALSCTADVDPVPAADDERPV